MLKSVVLGTDIKTGLEVSLGEEDRRLSLYVVGKAGMGKSKLLEHIAYQDIQNGDGLLFLDPHADSVELLLANIPQARREDVIWWDPTDTARPFGLNPFVCTRLDEVDSRADNFIAALSSLAEFAGVFEQAPRMKDVLLHLAIAFIVNHVYGNGSDYGNGGGTHNAYSQSHSHSQGSYTLAETPRFLTDPLFRARFYPALSYEYPQVREYWEHFDAKPQRVQSEQVESSLNKLRRFQVNRTMRGVFGQSSSSIDFRAAMDAGKIVLVKLPGEGLGPDNAAFIGAFIVWGVFEAALSRGDIAPGERRQFHLIADEFQTFMSTAFPRLLSEARKFGVDTTIAHQTRGQLTDERTRQTTLIVGNKVVFAVTGRDAEEMAREFRIEVPPPEVSGWKPKHALVVNPYDFLSTHGLDDKEGVRRYQKLRGLVDIYFLKAMVQVEEMNSLLRYNGLEPETATLSQRTTIKRQMLEAAINKFLYDGMQISLGQFKVWQRAGPEWQRILRAEITSLHVDFYFHEAYKFALPYLQAQHAEWWKRYQDCTDQGAELMTRISGIKQPWIDQEVSPEQWPLLNKGLEEQRKFEAEHCQPIYQEQPRKPSYQHEMLNGVDIDDDEWTAAWWLEKWERDFRNALFSFGWFLNQNPVMTATGEMEPVTDKPRLYSDVEAEMANSLATLPRFQARASIQEAGRAEEYTLVMRAPLQSSPQGEAQGQSIAEWSRLTYGRGRDEVEAAIRARTLDSLGADNSRSNWEAAEAVEAVEEREAVQEHSSNIHDKSHRPGNGGSGTIPRDNYGRHNKYSTEATATQNPTYGEGGDGGGGGDEGGDEGEESLRDPK